MDAQLAEAMPGTVLSLPILPSAGAFREAGDEPEPSSTPNGCPTDARVTIETVESRCHGSLELTRFPATGDYVYIDIIYQNHAGRGGDIKYRCADFETAGRVLKNRRSHSLAIPRAALLKAPVVHFGSDVSFEIESATVRDDYYDYFGICSRSAAPERLAIARTLAASRGGDSAQRAVVRHLEV